MKSKWLLIPSMTVIGATPLVSLSGCSTKNDPEPEPSLYDITVDTYAKHLGDKDYSGIYSTTPIVIEPNHSYSICINFKNYVDLQKNDSDWILYYTTDLTKVNSHGPFSGDQDFYVDGNQSKKLVFGGDNIKNRADADYYRNAGFVLYFLKDSPTLSVLTQNNFLSGQFKTWSGLEKDTYYFVFCKGYH